MGLAESTKVETSESFATKKEARKVVSISHQAPVKHAQFRTLVPIIFERKMAQTRFEGER